MLNKISYALVWVMFGFIAVNIGAVVVTVIKQVTTLLP